MLSLDKIKNKIPLASALAVFLYLFTYFFHFGYAYYLGFPTEFIQVDLNLMLTTSGYVLLVCLFLGRFIDTLMITNPKKYIQIGIMILMFTLILNVYLFSIKAAFDPLRGVFDNTWFIIFSFSSLLVYSTLKLKTFITRDIANTGIADVVFLAFTITVTAGLSGAVFSMTPMKTFITTDGYILLGSYGDGLVLGKCEKNLSTFKRVSKNNGETLVVADPLIIKEINRCFSDKTL
ncbi:hypothetical protein E0D81_14615 [Lelliottia amnigena]|nr:hypothetical protein [Lelliottia amnigena]MBL5898553.1 hypothetical protein [Lelliottia amnigena]TCD17717.1 hypothetical protein E0D81_14615 [Lelliottia amnigena]